MATKKAVNSQTTAKKPRGKGKPFLPNTPESIDERINRTGAPKRGASLKEIYDYYDKYTSEEIAAMLPPGDLKRRYQQMQKGILLKDLKALTINAAIIFDPTPGLIREYHERTDGKVPDKVQHEGTLNVEGLQETLKKVYSATNNTSDS